MSYHVVNPAGRVVALDTVEDYERWIATPGFRNPNKEEMAAFMQSREELHNPIHIPDGYEYGEGIYIRTVESGGKDGYGIASDKLIQELKRLDVKISRHYQHQKVGIVFHAPDSIVSVETPYRILYTMFESDRIPDVWKEYLPLADKILVPSKWCQKVFAEAGFDSEVVPLGYDPNTYYPVERISKRDNREDYVFLHFDAFNVRKGFMEVFQAFAEEFQPDEPVKMIFKTVKSILPPPAHAIIDNPRYANIEVVQGEYDGDQMLELCKRSDCFVFPSRGEGFGMTPMEAMATGMPAIIPNAHGLSEYFNEEHMYGVTYSPTPAIYHRWKGENVGQMIKCDVADLRRQMRYVYEHQTEARMKGQAAAEYVKQWTYYKTATRLKEILDEALTREIQERQVTKELPLELVD